MLETLGMFEPSPSWQLAEAALQRWDCVNWARQAAWKGQLFPQDAQGWHEEFSADQAPPVWSSAQGRLGEIRCQLGPRGTNQGFILQILPQVVGNLHVQQIRYCNILWFYDVALINTYSKKFSSSFRAKLSTYTFAKNGQEGNTLPIGWHSFAPTDRNWNTVFSKKCKEVDFFQHLKVSQK